ncbi:hypothetical protein Sme01_66690 [Sphaerisporangium melleum]|uniref:Uncharacterized protein n=1 Tax=Sphaerisporangium melleum TaxID=321316 RepID=A0A917RHH1_9ACTN|nr:hypothetical protein GCM10007964_55920 [Sphaerisporangium melleum]GII74193.1 hypothetical protein Sme01_66690 [Sphaerisporangium melleum]
MPSVRDGRVATAAGRSAPGTPPTPKSRGAHGRTAVTALHRVRHVSYSLTAASTRATFVAAPAGSSTWCMRSPHDHQ